MPTSYTITRWALGAIWLYHGLVPKLIFRSPQEVMMNERFLPFWSENAALNLSGAFEVIYAVLLLVFFRNKYLVIPTIIFGTLATVALLVFFPSWFTAAFNPFSINLGIVVLAWLNLVTHPGTNSGGPSRRTTLQE